MLGRYWEMTERLKVTQIYTSPTALRMLLKSGDEYVKKYDRSSLRILGCGKQLMCTCTRISETGETTPTKIGLHAFHVNLYLHEFFELILFFDPHGL